MTVQELLRKVLRKLKFIDDRLFNIENDLKMFNQENPEVCTMLGIYNFDTGEFKPLFNHDTKVYKLSMEGRWSNDNCKD